ncbi:MAG: phosphoribosylformylglycinamidine cyclo-ligase, partial [Selenomonadaceae bacterium]|nr:phosphoribosylformylglycinamidine cyclo-ligase [Selenomonadaceae bacterium]
IFKLLQKWGNVPRREMFRTFNCGIGMTLIVDAEIADDLTGYKIGRVVKGGGVEILGGELDD